MAEALVPLTSLIMHLGEWTDQHSILCRSIRCISIFVDRLEQQRSGRPFAAVRSRPWAVLLECSIERIQLLFRSGESHQGFKFIHSTRQCQAKRRFLRLIWSNFIFRLSSAFSAHVQLSLRSRCSYPCARAVMKNLASWFSHFFVFYIFNFSIYIMKYYEPNVLQE